MKAPNVVVNPLELKHFLMLIFFVISSSLIANTYYVSPTGNDSNPGTLAAPWATWQKAFNTANAGDTVYFRGGVYMVDKSGFGNNIHMISPSAGIGHDGTTGNPINYFNYPGEVPILDCNLIATTGNFNTGIFLNQVNYLHFRGLTIRNVKQKKDYVECFGIGATDCSNITFENVTIHDIGGNAFRFGGAFGYYPGITSDTTKFINCDAYNCCDSLPRLPGATIGGAADGFKTWNEPGSAFIFEGCRAWNCSDDGFDPGTTPLTVIKNCWAFNNGYLTGDGTGFKTGGNLVPVPFVNRIVENCIAAFNNGSGFFLLEYPDYYRTNARFNNNISYKNAKQGFHFSRNEPQPIILAEWRNNISYNNTGVAFDNAYQVYTESNNSWDFVPGSYPGYVATTDFTLTDADFVSLDVTQLDNPRNADGSLPEVTFAKLVAGSDLIDKGIDVGLPYNGSAPDVGAWEYASGGAPATPIYVNSEIKNLYPSVIEMNYNLALANIVPATTAFSVMVNSVSRTISSVSISGTKVLLTLASPVVYGNVVSLAYTRPALNPLQTAAGGQAASISAQSVTNNVGAVNPVYVSSLITTTTPTVIEMTYNLTLTNIVPAASAFSVMVNSVSRTVSSVSISGTRVLLTLASPVVSGNVVTIAYNKPATNPLQTAAGGQAVSLSAQPVTNNVGAVNPVYVSSLITSATPTVLEMTYDLTLSNIVPVPAAFDVKVNSLSRTVSSVSVSGTKVLLTLSTSCASGNVVTVAYNKPATNPLQCVAGGQAASISAQPVTNNVGSANPVYVSSLIASATPAVLEITYDLTLANIVPAASAFSVMVNSVSRTVSSVSISGTKVLLTLASPVVNGNVVSIAYNKPATNPLQTAGGGQAASLVAQAVTNNVTAPIPVYVSSVITGVSPAVLEMTYNLALANIVPAASAFSVLVNSVSRTVSSVSISGTKVFLTLASPVVNGNVVSIAYSKPAANPLQTAGGGQAASIGAQAVTNNVSAINPVYVSSLITSATPTVLEMTYDLTLTNIVPAPSAFDVKVNSLTRTVSSVSISGTKVLLTLATSCAYGNIVSVAYNKPAANPLQTAAGAQAASIGAQAVTNNVGAVNPVYVSSVVTSATPTVLEMTYDLTLANIVPVASAFDVRVNSVSRTVNSVSISGTKVLLTLGSSCAYGNVVSVAYNKPASNPLQTAAGGQAASLLAQPVTNGVSPINPVYISSVIKDASPTVLEMTYDQSLANIVPAPSAFDVKVNSLSRNVTSVSISGSKILLTLESSVVYGNVVSIAYNKPATNPLQTAAGGQAASISAQAVLNNCTQAPNQPPTISISSPVNYKVYRAPATIVITAEAFDSDGTITKVEFFNGSNKLGEATTAPYTVSWSNVPKGRYPVTAVATDNRLSRIVSYPVTVIVRSSVTTKADSEIRITEPDNGKRFVAPAKIDIRIDAYDPDSIIRRIEYFAGKTKIGENFQAPYSLTFESHTVESFIITSVAYDEFNEIVSSSFVDVFVDEGTDPVILYPNPNDGRFSIGVSVPLQAGENIINVINSSGKTVFHGTWSKEENTRQFDLSRLDPGIYILIIKSQDNILTKKFIIK